MAKSVKIAERARVAALAFAMWDASNSTRLPAEENERFIALAARVLYMLRTYHGHDVTRSKRREHRLGASDATR